MTAEEWLSRAVGNALAGAVLALLGCITETLRSQWWAVGLVLAALAFFVAALVAIIKCDAAMHEENR